jgi:hypothetical protein
VSDDELVARGAALIAAGRSTRDAADELAAATGRPRREVYRLIARHER